MKLPSALIGCCIVSAALAGWTTKVWLDRSAAEKAKLLRSVQGHSRCLDFWAVRSAIADANFEFKHGRRGLIQTVYAVDPSLDYWTPGLRPKTNAEVRKDFPFRLPEFDDGASGSDKLYYSRQSCDPTLYAWDYNVTMLRLLGRENDGEPRSISPELRGDQD